VRVKYSRFEILAFLLGSAAIVASAFVPATASTIPLEVVAQLLLILVLAGALHWGRSGGFVSALVATAIYVGMRFTTLEVEGLSADMMTMIVSRVLAYTLVGLAGGEISGRIKYLLAKAERGSLVDAETGVYNAAYASRAIASALGQWARYETPYSVVELALTPAVWSALKPKRSRTLMRQVASEIRNDVRLVDDVAYRGNGRFLVLLPSTPAEGAMAAAGRLHKGVAHTLGSASEMVTVNVLSCGRDDEALGAIAEALAPAEGDPASTTPMPGTRVTGRRSTDDRVDG
jgi:GGDEF domain-containing protein